MQIFWLPKQGNSVEEYEDSFAHSPTHFAVADGATESSFADRWAKSLVQQFVEAPPEWGQAASPALEPWLTPLQKSWHDCIPWDRLPWYAEEKAHAGAFAALIGLRFGREEKKRFHLLDWFRKKKGPQIQWGWQALAVGDSCLFQVRNNSLLRAFPMERSTDFNSRPLLISSNPARNATVWKAVQLAEGECQPNDLFILTTDALGQWFLRLHEAGEKPWTRLAALKSEADFIRLVEEGRRLTFLRNDDTTLLLCRWNQT